MIPNTGNIL